MNKLKQWGLGMQMYHDNNDELPLGASSSPRQTWVMYLWPFIEQENLADINDYAARFHVPPNTIYDTMDGSTGQAVELYTCPSEVAEAVDQTNARHSRRRGNYVVCWGTAIYTRPPATDEGDAVFSHVGGRRNEPRKTSFKHIVDGTSKTLMMSEYLKAWSTADNDWRGDIHNDDGAFRFNTRYTPNTSAPDVIPGRWYQDTGDPLMPVTTGAYSDQQNAARSRHPGGVNGLLCDGSVEFYVNDIALGVWEAMGSMNGNEVIDED